MTDQGPPARVSGRVPKLIALGIVAALVLTMAGIGYHHATRNRIRHAPGSLSGKQLYELYCDRCHGADLKGDRTYASLVARPFTLEEMTQVVKNGREATAEKPAMPKFADLDATDLQRLHEYVAERRAQPR